jgi:hypothetical protein
MVASGSRGFLFDEGDARALLHLQRAVVGLGKSAQDPEQRGLACAVAPDQADAFIGFEEKPVWSAMRHARTRAAH